MSTGTTEKRARARAAKLIRAIALSAIMAATVILPLSVLAETPRGGLDSLGISATEAAINPGDDTQISDLNLNQQNPENGGNGGSLQDDAGVEATGNEPEAPVEGEPEAPADNEPEAPADNEPEAPADDEPEAPADDEHETPVDGEPAHADQAQSESADANPINNKPVKAMANGINVLEEDVEPGVYTVGAGKNYTTPEAAIADTGDLRADDNAPWVMELHENVTLTKQITIPADMTLTIRSAEGQHYTIDADKKSRVIDANGSGISLTLANVTITGGYNASDTVGAGVYVSGAGSSLTMEAGSVVSGNENASFGTTTGNGYGGGVYITGANASFVMRAGSTVSENTSGYAGGGVYVSGSGASLTMEGGSEISGNSTGLYGGGVYVISNASLIMEAGSAISRNKAVFSGGGVYISGDTSLIMEGGAISYNEAVRSNGGGVSVAGRQASVTMKAGSEISHNLASGSGGGVIAVNSASLTMEAGSTISENTANNGGGVYLSAALGGGPNASLTMKAGSMISSNTAGSAAGGVYGGGDSTITMQGGEVSDNKGALGGGVVGSVDSAITLENGKISNNTATDTNGGGLWVGANTTRILQSFEISNNTAKNGGGVYTNDHNSLSIQKGAQVAFFGNKASGTPYALSEADRITPRQAFEGDITSLSVEGINEANGFDVSSDEAIAAANKKSVFNNYDIAYRAGTQLDVLTISYLNEDSEPISEAETLLYQGKKPYPLPDLPGSPKQGMGWSLTEADDGLVVSTAGGAVGKEDVLAPASGLGFELTKPFPSHRVSVKLAPAPYIYAVRFLDYDGTALDTQRVSHGAAAVPPTPPTREGYSFTGWSAGFGDITADTDITARYEALTTPPTPPTPIAPWPTPPTPIAPVAPEPKPEPTPESKPEPTPESTTVSAKGSGTETPTAKTPATSVTQPSPPAGQTTAPVAETPATDYPATDGATGPNATTAAETGTGAEAGAGNEAENGQGTGNAEAKAAGSPLALLSGNGEIVSQGELRDLARKAGVPLVGIGDRAVPLIGIDGYAFWSLADLAIILFAAAIAAWNILAYRRRRGQGGLAADTETGGNARPLPIAILAIAIANAALFLLSQDFAAAPLVLVDIWTIPEAALFIAECMLASIAGKRANAMYGDSEEVGNAVEVRNA